MATFKLKLTDMANGGAALGRDKHNRVIFVPFAIPGELVEVSAEADGRKFTQGRLEAVLEPSPHRVDPRCAHFGAGCCSHFQHIAYQAQLNFKAQVVMDQLKRIGGLKAKVLPMLPSPKVWECLHEIVLSPTAEGGMGLWSAAQRRVVPIQACQVITQPLQALMSDFDLALPGLRRVTLRQGMDEELLVALEIEGVEPPELLVDFPVSVAIVLPDRTAANLIGHNFVVQEVGGREFQVSAGCYFWPNPDAAALVAETVMKYAALDGNQTVLELYSGVGTLTAFLAAKARAVLGIEVNSDAVADAAVNLDETENVSLYEGLVEDVLPLLDISADLAVVDPPLDGLSAAALEVLVAKRPSRIIYVSSDVATLARDGKQLAKAGYRLGDVQPIDMFPHWYHTLTVSVWRK